MSTTACPFEPDYTPGLWDDDDTPDDDRDFLPTTESMRRPVLANYGCCDAHNRSIACGRRRHANTKPKLTK